MKRHYFYNLLWLVILFIVQAAALKVFAGKYHFVPQLTLVFVVLFAIRHSYLETLWFSFAAGFLNEIFSGRAFGGDILAMVGAGLLIYFFTRKLTAREIVLPTVFFLVILATAVFHVLAAGYSMLLGLAAIGVGVKLSSLYVGFFSTLFMNLLFFYPIALLERFLPKQDV